MATLTLGGLESKPKLNGRVVTLLDYHSTKGRWEVELDGAMPNIELFSVEWNNGWYEPVDDNSRWKDEVVPTFKEVLEEKLEKLKVQSCRKDLVYVDSNLRPIAVLGPDGDLLEDLSGKYIRRKAEIGTTCQTSFPVHVQKRADGAKTLGVRPASLRIKEDEAVDRLRFRKVEISVGVNHRKPELDGQFGELQPFQAHAAAWEVNLDRRALWDVAVDGTRVALCLPSSEVCDEASGDRLRDPVRIAPWDRKPTEKALYANVAFKRGEVILAEEPSPFMLLRDRADLERLCQQFRALSSERKNAVLDLTRGPDHLWRLLQAGGGGCKGAAKEVTQKDLMEVSEKFKQLPPREREDAWSALRAFDNNFHWHAEGCLLYFALSRVNHSCQPNAVVEEPRWDPPPTTPSQQDPTNPCSKVLIAQRDIAEGEEITVSYLQVDELLEPLAMREKSLKPWAFKCLCKRCAAADSGELLRTFACTADASCCGLHAVKGDGLGPCTVCGAEARDAERILREEEMHVSAYKAFITHLSKDGATSLADDLVQILECAKHSGLREDHWVMVKARDALSCYYQRHNRLDYAVEHLEPIIELHKRVFGCEDWRRLEALADLHTQRGSFVQAFGCYAAALRLAKETSPERPAGQASSCDRLRKKLRGTLEGKSTSVEDVV